MTLGDLLMFIVFTGMMAAPVIQIASISTQISEAFAGLDRIRELNQLTTEGDEDASPATRCRRSAARSSSTTCTSNTPRACRC
jgi:ABC-type bacteriocin/lantibiotic exporter with double-glycine peptidase domain